MTTPVSLAASATGLLGPLLAVLLARWAWKSRRRVALIPAAAALAGSVLAFAPSAGTGVALAATLLTLSLSGLGVILATARRPPGGRMSGPARPSAASPGQTGRRPPAEPGRKGPAGSWMPWTGSGAGMAGALGLSLRLVTAGPLAAAAALTPATALAVWAPFGEAERLVTGGLLFAPIWAAGLIWAVATRCPIRTAAVLTALTLPLILALMVVRP